MSRVFLFASVLTIAFHTGVYSQEALPKVTRPPAGTLYHGVFPGGPIEDFEGQIRPQDLDRYVRASGHDVAWVYFSHDWALGRDFPSKTVNWIRDYGSVPFIRLILRSSTDDSQNSRETYFTLQRIAEGEFDDDLWRWGQQAANCGSPVIVEFGTECNGHWFPWNAVHNGAGETEGYGDPQKADGHERFVDAYRRIVEVIRDQAGAKNITWVLHVNAASNPDVEWNSMAGYYPGDDYVDWLGVSVYGPQSPKVEWVETFTAGLDGFYQELEKFAPNKPVIVAEFGCTSGFAEAHPDRPDVEPFRPGVWARAALEDMFALDDQQEHLKRKNLIGFAWWNERWSGSGPDDDSNMTLETVYDLGQAFREKLSYYALPEHDQLRTTVSLQYDPTFYVERGPLPTTGLMPRLKSVCPEKVDLDEKLLQAGIDSISQDEHLLSCIIARYDQIAVEKYFNKSKPWHANNAHSVSKSVLSVITGIALNDENLGLDIDQPISMWLEPQFKGLQDERKQNITIRHLLTMSSGLEWCEDKTEYQVEKAYDWVHAILKQKLVSEPGATFHYSSGNTHLLSAVLQEAIQKYDKYDSLRKYAQRNLFDQIGVDVEYWGRDPQGYYSGGFNFFVTPQDLTAFGLLCANGGKGVIPDGWLEKSWEGNVDPNYGYLWEVYDIQGQRVVRAVGYGGQFIYILPELEIVTVLTSDTLGSSINESDFDKLIEEYVIPAAQ